MLGECGAREAATPELLDHLQPLSCRRMMMLPGYSFDLHAPQRIGQREATVDVPGLPHTDKLLSVNSQDTAFWEITSATRRSSAARRVMSQNGTSGQLTQVGVMIATIIYCGKGWQRLTRENICGGDQ